jgi:hypothetical protein
VVWNKERDSFRANCSVYKSLTFYKHCVTVGKVWPWWLFAKCFPYYVSQCRQLLNILVGNHVISERLRQRGVSRMCQQCTMMVADSVPHMLFECECAANVRQHLWTDIIRSSPTALYQEMTRMSNIDLYIFWMSGFHSTSFIKEWSEMYINICKCVYVIYAHKVSIMTQ